MKSSKNDGPLQSDTLHTTKSVLAAQHQSQRELIRAKEELELKAVELDYSVAILRATLESTSDGIIVMNGLTNVIDFNEKFLDMFGVSRETLLNGDNWRELAQIQFKYPDNLRNSTKEIVDAMQPESTDVLELADGRVFERYSKLLNIHNPGSGRVWSFHDITKQRQHEKEQQAAKALAEKRAKASEDFMALLSHEMRVPLTPVLMMATALREDERLPADVREQFQMIERNIALEVRLIDDLNDLTAITYKKLPLNKQESDAHLLIDLAVELVLFGALSKEISIERDFSASRSGVVVDPARFQQIIWNLLRNAIKFTPVHGRILIRTSDGDDGWMRIEVTDTGIGMEPKDLEKIFLPLEQLSIERERRFGGLGLGLAIVKSLVELHGGKIYAHSDGIDRGSTFIFELPGAKAPINDAGYHISLSSVSLPSDTPTNLTDPVHTRFRLLLVDDHPITLQVISTLLARDGHHVVPASTMSEALEKASENDFDLVISDLGLPDGSGYQLMEKLHNDYNLRGVALSGYGTEDDIKKSKEAGFAFHLVKPVHIAEIRKVLTLLGK